MCIYFVKNYTCGHYADALAPTLLGHCRRYDTCLRYWHDQIYYQPLEASSEQFGTLMTPQPCRPIWPISFPGDAYLPVPKTGRYPRGLARPRPNEIGISAAEPHHTETLAERIDRENRLIRSIGSFGEVAAHQELQSRLSFAEETSAYQALYPNLNAAQSVRLYPYHKTLLEPPYPLAFVTAILEFNQDRYLPGQTPNVIITPQQTGCLRTSHEACNYDPTTTTTTSSTLGPQCPWLLSIRTPWLYPRRSFTGLPYPHREAAFLADLTNRGGAKSNHNEKDAHGSELIKIALNQDGSVGHIDPVVYHRLQSTVPEGPFLRAVAGRNVFAEPFVARSAPVELPTGEASAPVELSTEQESAPVELSTGEASAPIELSTGEASAPVGSGNRAAEAAGAEEEEESLPQEAPASALDETDLLEEAPVQLPGYRYPAGWGEVDWVSEGGREEEEEEEGGGRSWRSEGGW